MPRIFPRSFLAGSVAGLVAVSGYAQAPVSPTAPLPPELQAELDALTRPAWQHSETLRASVGWRDNILLSPFAPIQRAFGRAEIEGLLWRPMQRHWEFLSFVNGDVLRYFSPPTETGGEQQWSLHAEERWQPIAPLRLALKSTGYVRDMVLDLSETENRRIVAPTRVRGAQVAAVARVTLPAGFLFEPLTQVKRSDFRDYPGDYDQAGAGARLEWHRGDLITLSAAWFEDRRRYAERTEFTASGRALPGTHLRFAQRDGEIKARSRWQRGGDWGVTVTTGRLENRDEASGYFDYNQKRGRLEVGWKRAAWNISLDGEMKRMDYLVQTVGTGIAPPRRISEDFDVALRVEREISDRWTLFAEHRRERSRSNEIEFSYRANTVLAGVQRSF